MTLGEAAAEAGAAPTVSSPSSYQMWRKAHSAGNGNLSTPDVDSLLHQIERFKISALKNQFSERLSPKKRTPTKTKPFPLSSYRRGVAAAAAQPLEGGVSAAEVADTIYNPESFGTNKFLTKEGAARELLHGNSLDTAERLSTLSRLLRDADRALTAATIENKRYEKIILQERAEAELSRKQAEEQIHRLKTQLIESNAELTDASSSPSRTRKHMTPAMRQKRLIIELQERCADASVEKLNLETRLDDKKQQCEKLQKQLAELRSRLSNQALDRSAADMDLAEENRRLQERIRTLTAEKRNLHDKLALATRTRQFGSHHSSPVKSPRAPKQSPSPRRRQALRRAPVTPKRPSRSKKASTPKNKKCKEEVPGQAETPSTSETKESSQLDQSQEDPVKSEEPAQTSDPTATIKPSEVSSSEDSDSSSSSSDDSSSQEDDSSSDEDDDSDREESSQPSANPSGKADLEGFVQHDGKKVWARVLNGNLSWGPSQAQCDKNSFALSSVGRVRAAGGRLIVKLDKGIKVFEMANTDQWLEVINRLKDA